MNQSVSGLNTFVFAYARQQPVISPRRLFPIAIQILAASLLVAGMFAQETTGGLQGTVKDPSGALVANARIVVTGTTLIGNKEAVTDSSGYYHFTNLPPGTYSITATAQGFETLKSAGLIIEVGHLPSLDLRLEVGSASTVVEVSGQASMIDVTTETTQTNVTADVIQDVPHGRSFQSVIQFAPSARNEPLAGSVGTNGANGTGGQSPGSSGNGQAFGYSVGGGSDSENSYLVEGQDTADEIGGFSHTNVPFDFIQEVQVKSSGIEAEHGGALGAVVNVVMKKGSNSYHGSLFTEFQSGAMNGSPNAYSRYDPQDSGNFLTGIDPQYQQYQPIRPHTSDNFPGFTLGGPILKDRIWFFLAANPELNRYERSVDFSDQGLGTQSFSQNTDTYYTNARIDAALSQKIRVFASWLYQLQRQTGATLPAADSTNGLFNVYSTIPVIAFGHDLGYVAPNSTTNVGADFTLTPKLVATTRFGYFFENYHDFGYPTSGETDFWEANGQGAGSVDGTAFPSNLEQATGYFNAPQNQNYTLRNVNKHIQFDQDVAWFKSGWGGTHNFKFGYQLNRETNNLSQRYNQPFTQIFPGNASYYSSAGLTGFGNCAALVAANQAHAAPNQSYGDPAGSFCTGTYGYADVVDYGSSGSVTSLNHGFFAQDAWTIGHGVTINAGLRIEKEYLPGETTAGLPARPIQFGWGDKIAPRVGAAWDVFKDGRMKVFGSYGVFNDIMKLNLAISSFGGQYWQQCAYALMTPDAFSELTPVFDSNGRYCSGGSTGGANFAGGSTPAGLIFLENVNERGTEGVTPGLKPYRQHESVFGVDYQLGKNLAFEARWDRRRLDHVIEDAALFNSTGEEVFTIINPGFGQNAANATCATAGVSPITLDPYAACPLDPKAARSYDGVEFRLTKTSSKHFYAMVSYTYSHLRGNYTGLTSTDIADGGGGRDAPNNSRAFDETYFSFNANGNSSSGLLPTDRPNTFKGYTYYELGWKKRFATDFGLFQYFYQGSPVSSYVDVGYSQIPGNFFAVYPEDRGKWVDVSGTTGDLTVSNPSARRTPWFIESDFNLTQSYKISESKVLSFSATIPNMFNQRAITAYNEQIDSAQFPTFLSPGGLPFYYGAEAYSDYEHPYDWKTLLNTNGIILDSQYGKPYLYQLSRNIRLGLKFTF